MKVAKNITLEPADWELAAEAADTVGNSGNLSAGLRAIIAKYRRLCVGASPVEMMHVAADAAFGAAFGAKAEPGVASAVYTAVVQAMRKFMEEGR